jgi:hypothetical protein
MVVEIMGGLGLKSACEGVSLTLGVVGTKIAMDRSSSEVVVVLGRLAFPSGRAGR